MDVVVFRNVRKVYRGSVVALRGASFTVPRGVVAGLLGPNGAGKTTSMRLIMGFIKPNSGLVKVFDVEPWVDEDVRLRIGYLPERPIYPRTIAVGKLLEHLARLQEVPLSEVKRVAKLVGIDHLLSKPVSALSRGYLQRLGIAQALLGDPELLVLDEPTSNLDPPARREILNMIKVLAKELKVTILFSTHILQELQEVADYAILINNGVVIDYGLLSELTERYGLTAVYSVEASEPRVIAKQLLDYEFVEGVYIKGSTLRVHVAPRGQKAFEALLDDMVKQGFVRDYKFETTDLTSLYMRVIGGESL